MKEAKMGESFQTCPLSSFGFFVNQKRNGGVVVSNKTLQHQKEQIYYLVAFIKEY